MECAILAVILVMIAFRGNGGCLGAMIVIAILGGALAFLLR
jgi:hypothetical protein